MIGTDCVPEVASCPLQSPAALHALALVDDQVSVTVPSMRASLAEALKVAVGATGGAGVLDAPPPPPPQETNRA